MIEDDMKDRVITLILLCLLLPAFALSACTSIDGSNNPETAAAQTDRSVQMATQMALQLQATNEVRFVHVTATAKAFQSVLEATRLWTVAFEDTFDEDSGDWPVGEDDGDLAAVDWRISAGKYQWHANANSGFVWWALPEAPIVRNFYVAADVGQIDGPPDGEAGLVFRSDSDTSYYNFGITNEGNYSLYMHSQDGWEALIDWIPSRHLKIDGVNRLAVIAQDERLLLFINDHFLVEYVDERFLEGEVGLIIGLSYAGEEGHWEFDNFELRTPHGDTLEAVNLDANY